MSFWKKKKCYFEKTKFSLKNIYLSCSRSQSDISPVTHGMNVQKKTDDGTCFSSIKLNLTDLTRCQLRIRNSENLRNISFLLTLISSSADSFASLGGKSLR